MKNEGDANCIPRRVELDDDEVVLADSFSGGEHGEEEEAERYPRRRRHFHLAFSESCFGLRRTLRARLFGFTKGTIKALQNQIPSAFLPCVFTVF